MRKRLIICILAVALAFSGVGMLAACGAGGDAEYALITADGVQSYELVWVGSQSVSRFDVPSEYNGKPVTSIGEYAFYGCAALTDVVIPNSVVSIGKGAFYGCTALRSVSVGSGIASVGEDAFYGCDGLLLNEYAGGQYIGNSTDEYIVLVKVADEVSTCVLNADTKVIYAGAFYGCAGLANVVIPNGLRSIGKEAFSGCAGLMSITLTDSVVEIGERAFSGCESLTSITLGSGLERIGEWAFDGCDGLLDVNYGGEIGDWCGIEFGNELSNPVYCAGSIVIGGATLSELEIPSSVRRVNDFAFIGCVDITSVSLSNTVAAIGDQAFSYCTELTQVTIGGAVRSIGKFAFRSCGKIESVNFTGSVGGWCAIAFEDCFSNPTYYAKNLYVGGSLVTQVALSDSVTAIGAYAFERCVGLRQVAMTDSVRAIGEYAFDGCTALNSVVISSALQSVGDNAFSGCTALVYNNVGGGAYLGNSQNECVVLVSVADVNVTSFTVNAATKIICSYAFYDCDGLTEVALPNSIVEIGGYAFCDCDGLETVIVPTSVVRLGEGVFSDCASLLRVTLGGGLTFMGDMTFYGSARLTTVEFGGTIAEWRAVEPDLVRYASGLTVNCTDGAVVY